MIYIFTALYCEAHIFIKRFNLKKNPGNTWFQEFNNETEDIRLTVTGVGEINAAIAVSSVCSVYRPKQKDVLFNVGICAHMTDSDGIYLCNKIIEQTTGKTFYPDMLYRHDFCETAIITGMQPWTGENGSIGLPDAILDGSLYDMEAAAIYQAGSCFFGPHQMMFLKVVSDRGEVKEVSEKQTEHLMEKYQDCIVDYIRQIQMITQTNRGQENCLRREEEALLEKLCTDMHCSKAMRDSLRQYIRYLTLEGREYGFVIQDMYEKGLLPCKDKREGKLRFEELKRRLF